MKIRKKQLKFSFQSGGLQKQGKVLMIKFEDQYFAKNIDLNKFPFPLNVLRNYQIECSQKKLIFTPRGTNQDYWEGVKEQIGQFFKGIDVHHIREEHIIDKQEQFRLKLRGIDNNGILAYKIFHVAIGRYEQGDYLLYTKIRDADVKQLLRVIECYLLEQEFLFDMDTHLQKKSIGLKYRKQVTKKIVQKLQHQIKIIAKNIGLNVCKINACYDDVTTKQKRPNNSISIRLDGNGLNIHIFYLKIQEKVNQLSLNVIQIDQQIPPENANNLQSIFPQYRDKIFRISEKAVLIFDRKLQQIENQQVKRKLKLKSWIIGNDIFTKEEIKTFYSQHQLHSLKPYMAKKKVFWQDIQFNTYQIKIVCQKATKDKFIQEGLTLLKSFIRQQEICKRYDNCFIVQIFKKYYKKNFEQKFNVTFEIGQDYIIRHNFTKYSDDIQEQLNLIRDKIKKKYIKFISLQPLKNKKNLDSKIFMQKDNPRGYKHGLLGHCLYKMGNVLIRLKKIQSLNRQQECITYIFDDRIKDSSLFHHIIKTNKINIQNFLAEAHKSKKPDRLRQYITQDCQYGSKTVLLHAGPQRVTNTLRKDITTLFSLLNQRICGILFQHQRGFLSDIFTIVLQEIRNQSILHQQSDVNNSMSINKSQFEADFFYEGQQQHFMRIQEVLKKFVHPIKKISPFALQQADLQKIYALQYHSMNINNENNKIKCSPIIAQLLDYQLNRSIKISSQNDKKKKFIFSLNWENKHQLVQYVISTKSGLFFKVTHDEDKKIWSRRPYIEKIEQKDQQLIQIVSVIKKYLNRTDYIVISAQSITDGIHGREIKYCHNFYMAKQREKTLSPITIDLKEQKIHEQFSNNPQYTLQKNQMNNWYQITTYKQDLDIINSFLN